MHRCYSTRLRQGIGREAGLTCAGGAPGHPRHLVQAAVLHARLAGVPEAGEGLAALVRAALEYDVDHALQLVLAAEHAAPRPWHVAGGLLGALGVHAVLVAHVHHALLDVVLAVQPPGLPCACHWFLSSAQWLLICLWEECLWRVAM